MGRFRWLVASLLVLVSMVLAAPSGATAEPLKVDSGIYLNRVSDFDLKGNSWRADFYIWFRWNGLDGWDPIETFEVMNGEIQSKTGIVRKMIGEQHYAGARIVAQMQKQWDVTRFPLDRHTMTIEIEDSEFAAHQMVYVADVENSTASDRARVPGYEMGLARVSVVEQLTRTNYGDISLPTNAESVYSRMIYAVDIQRPDAVYFLKLFATVFVSSLVGFLAFMVKPTDLDPRFGLGVGAVFAVIASTFVISEMLPDTDRLTLADTIHVVSISIIFVSIVVSAISLKYSYAGAEATADRIDKVSLYAFPAAYVAIIAWLAS